MSKNVTDVLEKAMTNKIEVPRELLERFLKITDLFEDLNGVSMHDINEAKKEDERIIDEFRSLLAAPEAPRQAEPIYQVSKGLGEWSDVDLLRYTACSFDPEEYEIRALYTAPLSPDHSEPVAYMRNEGMPNNLVKCSFTCPGAFGVYRGPVSRSALPDHSGGAGEVVLPERDALHDLIAEVIGGDTYDCVRVWSAWGVGTMSEDDFVPFVDQDERLYELADAILNKVKELNQ